MAASDSEVAVTRASRNSRSRVDWRDRVGQGGLRSHDRAAMVAAREFPTVRRLSRISRQSDDSNERESRESRDSDTASASTADSEGHGIARKRRGQRVHARRGCGVWCGRCALLLVVLAFLPWAVGNLIDLYSGTPHRTLASAYEAAVLRLFLRREINEKELSRAEDFLRSIPNTL